VILATAGGRGRLYRRAGSDWIGSGWCAASAARFVVHDPGLAVGCALGARRLILAFRYSGRTCVAGTANLKLGVVNCIGRRAVVPPSLYNRNAEGGDY